MHKINSAAHQVTQQKNLNPGIPRKGPFLKLKMCYFNFTQHFPTMQYSGAYKINS